MTTTIDRIFIGLAGIIWILMIAGCADDEHRGAYRIYDNRHPIYDNRTKPGRPRNDAVTDPAGSAEATEIILAEFSARLDVDLPDAPPIVWFDGLPVHSGKLALVYSDADLDRRIMGAFVKPEIQLLDDGRDSLCDTSLEHELTHWALYQATGDAESNHVGSELWTPDVIHEICAVVREAGL